MAKLLNLVKKLLKKIGVDTSIAYSSGARIIQGVSGFITIFFVAHFLSEAEQGFYYTFGSLIAIQVFFELGLTNIITQYVAHEASHLQWVGEDDFKGEERYHSRLSFLLQFVLRWYLIVCIILLFVLLIVGIFFFGHYSRSGDDVDWFFPWLLICVATVLKLYISPLMSFIMGLNKVKDVMKMQFYQQILVPISTWIGLTAGLGLYVLGLASIISFIYVILYCNFTPIKGIFVNLRRFPISEKINYMKEIFPYQWKIALSWISGYFIFQLFNPVLFATCGPDVAGQMGMTLAVLNGISSFSMSWINTKMPLWSTFISLKDYDQLDKNFFTTKKQVSFVSIGLSVLFLLIVFSLRLFHFNLGNRFLPTVPLILMIIPLIVNMTINCWALYLRCHKEEPFLSYSLVSGILCTLSTVLLGKYYGVLGMTFGYCLITTILSFWARDIFLRCRGAWHHKINI